MNAYLTIILKARPKAPNTMNASFSAMLGILSAMAGTFSNLVNVKNGWSQKEGPMGLSSIEEMLQPATTISHSPNMPVTRYITTIMSMPSTGPEK